MSIGWLDNVPVSEEAYVFQADLLCEDCGRAAAAELSGKVIEDDGDSGTFPQGPYPDGGGEADSAQFSGRGRHCVSTAEVAGHKIGCPLRCPLTRDGAEAVWGTVRSCLVSPRKYDQELGALLQHLWGDYLDGKIGRIMLPASLPSLEKLVKKKYVLHPVALADPTHLYLLGITAPGQEYHLLRAEVDDRGLFARVESVAVPRELFLEARGDGRKVVELSGVEKLLRQAVEDGAWD